MSTKQIVRQRLHSAKNILNITKAMEVVASVQFRKLQHRIKTFRFYKNRLGDVIQRLQLASPDLEPHPLFIQREVKNIALIVVTGDKGLCGAYNSNAIRMAKEFLADKNQDNVQLYLLGKKGGDHFEHQGWKIRQSEEKFSHVFSENIVREWSEQYLKSYYAHEFDEMWVVYTHFHSVIDRETRLAKILPMVKDQDIPQKTEIVPPPIDFVFEPSPEKIYDTIIPYFFEIELESILLESYASELSSRMVAMKSSAKNAEEMIEKLTLVKNKLRQLSITNEILEITAGAESLR